MRRPAGSSQYELPEGQLPDIPDFGSIHATERGEVYDELFTDMPYAQVLALTILRNNDGNTEVLAGPRNPKVNVNHPNVISVPTMRIPPSSARAVLLNNAVEQQTSTAQIFRSPWVKHPTQADFERDDLGFIVAGTLCAKVGLSEVCELRFDEIDMRLASFTLGFSILDADPTTNLQLIEAIAMLNATVMLPSDVEVPASTGALSRLKWFGVEQFLEAYRARDAIAMFPDDVSAIEMCVHGVCMATSSRILERDLGLPGTN